MDFFGLVRLVRDGAACSRWEFADKSDDITSTDAKLNREASPPNEPAVAAADSNSVENADPCRYDGCDNDRAEIIEDKAKVELGKKKAKKRSKKRRGRANSTTSTDDGTQRHVHWGQVDEILFDRSLGEYTVPNSGLYPVALGSECDRNATSVDDHVKGQQLQLLQRVIDEGLNLDMLAKPFQEVGNGHEQSPRPLETRQWDYRRGTRNPLFTPMAEADRVAIISDLKDQSQISGSGITNVNNEILELRKGRENVGCSCKAIKPDKLGVAKLKQELIHHRDMLLLQRERATREGAEGGVVQGAVAEDGGPDNSTGQERIIQRRRASADSISELGGGIDDIFTLEKILVLSNTDIQQLPKNQLQAFMRTVTMSCPLCVSNNCACVAAGVGCHANVCGCSRYNAKQTCSNPIGLVSYEQYRVQQHRQQYVTNEPLPAATKTRPSRANTT